MGAFDAAALVRVKVPASAVPARSRRERRYVKDADGWWVVVGGEELLASYGPPDVRCSARGCAGRDSGRLGDVLVWSSYDSYHLDRAFRCLEHATATLRAGAPDFGLLAIWSEVENRWCEPVVTDDGTVRAGVPIAHPDFLTGDPIVRPLV